MKHIRTFESYKTTKASLKAINPEIFAEVIKESVLQIGDIYKVRSMIDIPQSLINSYVKKVKDTTGKNLRQFFGDVDIAEEIIKYVTTTFLDIDKIPGGAIMGGQTQAQTQGQGQVQVQTEPQAQTEPQVQAEVQPQVQTEAQPQAQEPVEGEFEEPAQAQAPVEGEEEEPKEEGEEEELPL